MSASQTPTTAPTPGPGAPKLRSSCDSCGTAKIKCDRGQTGCGRCVALGLPCIYRPSRKFGKPPRKRPGAGLDGAASLSYKKHTPRTAQDEGNPTTMGSMDFRQPQSTDEPAQLTDVLPLPSGINASLSIYEQSQFGSPFYSPLYDFDEWPQLDSFGASLEIPSVPNDSALNDPLSGSALEPVNKTKTSSDSHSCPRESYEILANLICPSPFLHAPEANSNTVSAQFDEVLHFNRDTIDRLSRLLKCPCAKSGHRVMVHASIISRILIWYQQAAEWTDSNSWEPRPSALVAPSTSCSAFSSSTPPSGTAAGTATTSPRTLAQSTGFVVSQVPVSMGTFNIEDQNIQAAFRNQLILSELKKTANLIDLFTSQGPGEIPANGVAGLYSYLGAWLRNEHSNTVRILRSRINALNENLES